MGIVRNLQGKYRTLDPLVAQRRANYDFNHDSAILDSVGNSDGVPPDGCCRDSLDSSTVVPENEASESSDGQENAEPGDRGAVNP